VLPPPPWSREQSAHRTRADRPALSRDAIVEAAVRVIDEEGFDAVSMRRVAQEFGTGAASLYAYVANKDELMDLVLDHVMAESRVADPNPAPDLEDWLEQIKDVVRRGYSTMLAHRDIAKVFLGRIPFGPNGLRNVEDLLNLLRAHGLPDYIAAYAGDLIGQYMVGSAIEDEMWRERFPDVTEQERSAAMTEVGDYLAQLPKDEFPNVTAMARLMVSEPAGEGPDPMDRFELGLDILVRGLASFLPARTDD
jgi:AcrR family transcriptional regulator